MPFADGALIQQKFHDLVPEELFEGVRVVEEIDAETAVSVKAD